MLQLYPTSSLSTPQATFLNHSQSKKYKKWSTRVRFIELEPRERVTKQFSQSLLQKTTKGSDLELYAPNGFLMPRSRLASAGLASSEGLRRRPPRRSLRSRARGAATSMSASRLRATGAASASDEGSEVGSLVDDALEDVGVGLLIS